MKTLILSLAIAFISITNTINLHSNESMFNVERILTDFRGVVANNDVILCYGDWGIITYSEDRGETWKQQNIGDSNCIQKIVQNQGIFYGASEHTLFKSSDNGKTWKFKKLFDSTEIKDMLLINNQLYLLTDNLIRIYDFELNPVLNPNEKTISLGFDFNAFEFVNDIDNLYISDMSGKFLSINLNTELIETNIDLKSLGKCDTCKPVHRMRLVNKNIYLKIDSEILISKDKGKTWESMDLVKNDLIYEHDNKLFALASKEFKKLPFDGFNNKISLYKIENLEITTSESIKFNIDTMLFNITYNLKYNDIISLSENELLAVGDDKLILKSNDGGKTWEIKSIINCQINQKHRLNVFKDKIYFVYDAYSNNLYTSVNKGATFLPRFYDSLNINGFKGAVVVSERGQVFVQNSQNNPYPNLAISNDYGKNFEFKLESKSNRHNINEGFDFEDKFLTICSNVVFGQYFTIAYLYDNDLNLLNTTLIDSTLTYKVHQDSTGNLYMISKLVRNAEKDTINGGWTFPNQYYKVFSSTDAGITWDSADVDMPGNLKHGKLRYANSNLIKNKLIYQFHDDEGKRYIYYLYDIETNTFDSLITQRNTSHFIEEYNGYFFIKSGQELLMTNDFYQSYEEATKFTFKNLMYNWVEYSSSNNTILNDNEFNFIKPFDNSLYLVYSSSYKYDFIFGGMYAKVYKSNIVKLTPKTHTSVENQIETPTYMYVKKPYPLPARNTVNAEVYWDLRHDIDIADIGIYNSMGSRVGGRENLNINKTAEYKGIVSWDCSGMSAGVYFIQIRHGDAVKSFTVVVAQ